MYAGQFAVNQPWYAGESRYLRRQKSGPTAAAIDLTVTPAFPGISAPTQPTVTPSTTGGTLPAGSPVYAITAYNLNGETTASPTQTATNTGSTSSNTVSWAAVTGATGYRIYKQVAGVLSLLADAGNLLSYVDTGALTPQTAYVPPTTNGTQVIANAVAGQVVAGDSLYRTVNGGVASLYNPANAGTYCGEAEENYPVRSGIDPNVLFGRPLYDPHPVAIAVRTSGEFRKKTNVGDVYTPGAPVYIGLDPQTVTVTQPTAPLAAPTGLVLTPSSSGGTLATATYAYRIVGVNANGTTVPGPEVTCSVTGPTGSVGLAWTALTGAISYQVFGRSSNVEQLLATVATNAYTDTGAATPSGLLPTANTTGTPPIGKVGTDQNPVGGNFSTSLTGALLQDVVIEISPPVAV